MELWESRSCSILQIDHDQQTALNVRHGALTLKLLYYIFRYRAESNFGLITVIAFQVNGSYNVTARVKAANRLYSESLWNFVCQELKVFALFYVYAFNKYLSRPTLLRSIFGLTTRNKVLTKYFSVYDIHLYIQSHLHLKQKIVAVKLRELILFNIHNGSNFTLINIKMSVIRVRFISWEKIAVTVM